MADADGFWIVLIVPDQWDTAPNPAGVFLVVPTLEQATHAVQDEVNRHYPDNAGPPLEWKRMEPFFGEDTVTPWGDRWIVWPTILTDEPLVSRPDPRTDAYVASGRPRSTPATRAGSRALR